MAARKNPGGGKGQDKGKSTGPAYTAAGYKATGHSAEVAGGRLLKNVEVQNRIAELQNRAAEKTGYTIVKATAELEEARRSSKE